MHEYIQAESDTATQARAQRLERRIAWLAVFFAFPTLVQTVLQTVGQFSWLVTGGALFGSIVLGWLVLECVRRIEGKDR